jgi:phage portal protein BeeE
MFRGGVLGYRKVGYLYSEGGYGVGDPVPLLTDEVVHFAPYPDPLATYRGMSWLTPVIREVRGDGAMSDHKVRYLANAATPNMVIRLDPSVTPDLFKRFKAAMDEEHRGPENAGKTLYLGGGADVTVVGSDFKQLDIKSVQGAGETRIAAAAGVPPVIVGLSEGLQGSSLNAGNYAMSRRRLADATMHPLWQNAAGSMAPLLPVPPGTRCWYDARDVPFLREDAADQAAIVKEQMLTVESGVRAGFEPKTVQAAVTSGDLSVMTHTGLYSVQLQPPGTGQPAITPSATDAAPAATQNGSGQ